MNLPRQVAIHGLLALCVLLTLGSFVSAVSPSNLASSAPSATGYNYQVLSGAHKAIGPQQVLVILVDFQDIRHIKSAQEIQNLAINQLNTYYSEVSYGKLTITGQAYGWYTVSHSMGFYGHDGKDPGDDDNLRQLARDAVALLPSSVDLTPFNLLMIVHAGQDQANDQSKVKSDEIWSSCYCSVFPNYADRTPIYAVRGKAFTNFLFLSELNGYGTFAHEFGHALGLPDLYQNPSSEGRSYVGYWSLMDSGNRCCSRGAESTPSYIGAWGAALLGWLTPTVADSRALVSPFDLKPLESPDASAILVPVSTTTYYLIEYRTQAGRDSTLPTAGILVYYVNEALRSGHGILQLVNPATQQLFQPQDHASDLNNAVFSQADRLRDEVHHVYLAFLGSGKLVTTLFSTQELTASIIQTQVNTPQTSLGSMYKDRLSLTATLVDERGMPMGGQAVQIDALVSMGQWQQVGQVVTDQLGAVSYELVLNYAVGRQSFRFFYPGGKGSSAWLASSSTEFSVNIQPAKMVLSLSQSPVTFGQSSLAVSVMDTHGEPVSNVIVTVYVNGLRQGEITIDENGKGTFPLLFSPADFGLRTVTVEAKATYYSQTQNSGTILLLPLWLIPIIVALIATGSIAVWKWQRRSRQSSGKEELVLGTRTYTPNVFCVSCGNKLPPDSKFCNECGEKLP
jgi:M6 family metalloprotease-like protein